MTAANESPVDKGEGIKPVGYYISSSYGLFPAPLPANSQQMDRAVKLFHFMGIFIAKALQDNRLVDLPLSQPLLKLISRAGAHIKLDSNNTFLITGNEITYHWVYISDLFFVVMFAALTVSVFVSYMSYDRQYRRRRRDD